MAITSTRSYLPSGTLANLGPINPSRIGNTGITGGMMLAPQNPTAANAIGNTGITGGGTPTVAGGDQSLAGMSPDQAVAAARTALGWGPNANQYRGQLDTLANYLNTHGQSGWQGGGTKADDWLQQGNVPGSGYDVISSGGQWQMLPDTTGAPGGGGGGAVTGVAGGGGSLIDDPGYQFQLGEGLKALQRSAAARGTLLTGGTLKGLNQYAQDYANTAYQNAFNRNMGVAQLGLNAANSLGALGQGYGNQAGNLYGALGGAQAAGTMGAAGQWGGLLGGAANTWQDYLNARGGGVSI